MIDRKTALITGAARGIGNAIAVRLAEDGYAVAIMDIIDEEAASENLKKVRERCGDVIYVRGDITSRPSREETVRKVIDAFGRIDVLVNNAGTAPRVRADLLDTTEESFDYVMNINLKGAFFLTQLVAREMIKEVRANKCISPKIINISSISAYTSSVQRGEYCISKAGVSMMTKLFADRLAEFGISVNEIRPGIILTDMTSAVKEKYDSLIENGLLPIKRWGYPEDVANAVSLLCSDKFGYSTGQVINVDGGFHLRRL